MRNLIPLLAVASAVLSLPVPTSAQPSSPSPRPGCAAEFAWITEYASRNYAGFDVKVNEHTRAAYDALLAELRPAAEDARTVADCDAVLARWRTFFQDGHLTFGRRRAPGAGSASAAPESPEQIRARFADRERVELTEEGARERIAAPGASRSALEGIWESSDGAYRVAVLRDPRPGRTYTMSILRADSVWWTPGQVKAVFTGAEAEVHHLRFFMRDHSEQRWTGRVERNVLVLDQGSPWFRVWPAAPGDVTREAHQAGQNRSFAVRDLSPGTILVQIPTFNDPRGIDSLFAAEGERIRGAERLVVDVRGNGGGSDFNFRHLLPLVYTRPIHTVSIEALATEENIRANETLAADTTWPEAQRQRMREFIARLETARGSWYVFPDNTHEEPAVLERPRRVDVLLDRGCASSCEQFLLAARQSGKVALYGDRSAGIIDFGNVRSARMPEGTLVLNHPTTRSKRLPHDPIDGVGIRPDFPVPAGELFPIEWVLHHPGRQPDAR